MDLRSWLGFLAFVGALACIYSMEAALRRLVRLKWNAYWRRKQRERATSGFRHKRSPWFRDAVQ